MLNFKLNLIAGLIFIAAYTFIESFAQNNIIYNKEIEDFLDRCEVIGLIEINMHQRPLSRQKIYSYLKEIEASKYALSTVMQDELDFFLREFSSNKGEDSLYFVEKNSSSSFRFLEYNYGNSSIIIYPDIGAGIEFRNWKSDVIYFNGISFYGNISSYFSFDFDYNDISIKRNKQNPELSFSNKRGWDYQKFFKSTSTNNYDIARGNISFSNDKLVFSLAKDYIYWGTNYDGNIIISDKAPSFPHLALKIFPWKSVEFSYLYGALNSMYYDSTSLRNTSNYRPHISLIEKYFAAHIVSLRLGNLNFSIGESVIISDRFEPVYLIPILFFRIADHYLSKTDYNSGNAQVFSAISYRFPSVKTRLDFSIFIDEMNITIKESPDAFAYSIGLTTYDILFDNSSLKFEYSRINPFVYTHTDPVQWYSNRGYNIGHWMGNNADRLFLQLGYTPITRLNIITNIQYIRKGASETPNQTRYQPDQSFLYGDKSYYIFIKAKLNYQLLNNFYLITEFGLSKAWGKNNLIVINDYNYNEFSIGFRYGFE